MILQGNTVLILPDGLPEKSAGGIAIPRTAEKLPITGKVVLCGPRCDEVCIEDRVHFARKAASLITINDVDHCLLPEDKIFYIE